MCAVADDEVAQCEERNTCVATRASLEKTFFCNCGRCFRIHGDLTAWTLMFL